MSKCEMWVEGSPRQDLPIVIHFSNYNRPGVVRRPIYDGPDGNVFLTAQHTGSLVYVTVEGPIPYAEVPIPSNSPVRKLKIHEPNVYLAIKHGRPKQ